jgi:hypothetical protein
MKPNAEQQEFIRQKLQGKLKVRETYDELYDHVLSALDKVPDDGLFASAVHQIIEHDLGGKRAMRAIQIKAVKIAVKDFIGEYFTSLGQSLKSPAMFIILPATVIYYLLMHQEWFWGVTGQTLPTFIILIPATIISANHLKVQKQRGWKTNKTESAKLLIKPIANGFMLFFPMILWPQTSIICHYLQRAGIMQKQIDYYGMPVNVATVLFFVISLHALVYYKMYKGWATQILAS